MIRNSPLFSCERWGCSQLWKHGRPYHTLPCVLSVPMHSLKFGLWFIDLCNEIKPVSMVRNDGAVYVSGDVPFHMVSSTCWMYSLNWYWELAPVQDIVWYSIVHDIGVYAGQACILLVVVAWDGFNVLFAEVFMRSLVLFLFALSLIATKLCNIFIEQELYDRNFVASRHHFLSNVSFSYILPCWKSGCGVDDTGSHVLGKGLDMAWSACCSFTLGAMSSSISELSSQLSAVIMISCSSEIAIIWIVACLYAMYTCFRGILTNPENVHYYQVDIYGLYWGVSGLKRRVNISVDIYPVEFYLHGNIDVPRAHCGNVDWVSFQKSDWHVSIMCEMIIWIYSPCFCVHAQERSRRFILCKPRLLVFLFTALH